MPVFHTLRLNGILDTDVIHAAESAIAKVETSTPLNQQSFI